MLVVLQERVHNHAKMARCGHTVAVIMYTDCLIEVLMFGGSSIQFKRDLDNIARLAQPVSLIYGENYMMYSTF
jgi:hypothetical protein